MNALFKKLEMSGKGKGKGKVKSSVSNAFPICESTIREKMKLQALQERGHFILNLLDQEPSNPDLEPEDPRKLQRLSTKEIAQMRKEKAARLENREAQKGLVEEKKKQRLIQLQTGQNLLMAAVKEANIARMNELFGEGISPAFLTKEGTSPLHLACLRGNVQTIDLLVRQGAETDVFEIREIGGATPLHLACTEGHLEAVKILLKHGANVNLQDAMGYTPLHICARLNRIDICKLLIAQNANGKLVDAGGHPPIYWSKRFNFNEVSALLPFFQYSWLEAGKHCPPARAGKKGAKRKSVFMEQYFKSSKGKGKGSKGPGDGSRPGSARGPPGTAGSVRPIASDEDMRIVVPGSRARAPQKEEVMTPGQRIIRAVALARAKQAEIMKDMNEKRELELEQRRLENEALRAKLLAEQLEQQEAEEKKNELKDGSSDGLVAAVGSGVLASHAVPAVMVVQASQAEIKQPVPHPERPVSARVHFAEGEPSVE